MGQHHVIAACRKYAIEIVVRADTLILRLACMRVEAVVASSLPSMTAPSLHFAPTRTAAGTAPSRAARCTVDEPYSATNEGPDGFLDDDLVRGRIVPRRAVQKCRRKKTSKKS